MNVRGGAPGGIGGFTPTIVGRAPNEAAIKIVEEVLERLRNGDFINIAVVAEQRDSEQMIMTYDVKADRGQALKMRGALSALGTLIDVKLLAPLLK